MTTLEYGSEFLESTSPVLQCWSFQGCCPSNADMHLFLFPKAADQLLFYTPSDGQHVIVKLVNIHSNCVKIRVSARHPVIGFNLQPGVLPRAETYCTSVFGNHLEHILYGQTNFDKLGSMRAWMDGYAKPTSAQHAKFNSCLARLSSIEFPVSIRQVCEEMNISARSLERWFLRFIGCSPFIFTRLVRLNHILAALTSDPGRPFADIAFEFGYADPAHFSRDFRRLTSFSPSEFKSLLTTPHFHSSGDIHAWVQVKPETARIANCWEHRAFGREIPLIA